MSGLENKTLADQYFLRRLAGQGGMGQVYEAWDRQRGTHMAIKVIHDLRFIESFLREATALKNLAHPNIVRFYGVEEDKRENLFFLVMDWVEGKDLQTMLKERQSPMGVGEVLHILGGVQKALHFTHNNGLYHCDIKPANIMLRNADNLPILSDFGLAHAKKEQGRGGTIFYMAPELIRDGHISIASDIYALGVTLYQLLSRQLPFQGETTEQIIQMHLLAAPPPLRRFNPSLPKGIVHVIEKALRKNPADRQGSVTQLWEEYAHYADSRRVESPTLSSGLYGLQGEKAHHRITTSRLEITIGRNRKNLICLRHPSVSRHHAIIFWKQDRYYIRDYGSTLGTFINGRRIRPNEPVPLHNQDKIKFGVADVFEFRTKRTSRDRDG